VSEDSERAWSRVKVEAYFCSFQRIFSGPPGFFESLLLLIDHPNVGLSGSLQLSEEDSVRDGDGSLLGEDGKDGGVGGREGVGASRGQVHGSKDEPFRDLGERSRVDQ